VVHDGDERMPRLEEVASLVVESPRPDPTR
jgi:hypothetical protein